MPGDETCVELSEKPTLNTCDHIWRGEKCYVQRLLYKKSGFCKYHCINTHLIIIPLAGKVMNLFICVKKPECWETFLKN